jgi:hypothetical protein
VTTNDKCPKLKTQRSRARVKSSLEEKCGFAMASFTVFEESNDAMALSRRPVPVNAKSLHTKENSMLLAKSGDVRDEHETAVAKTYTDASEHLDRWIAYIRWAQSELAQADVLGLLERCAKRFEMEPSVRSERKYLRVWILYADLCRDPKQVFRYMWVQRIGTEHALFFEAKAALHESTGDFARAAKTLAAGLKAGACPTERLHAYHQDFKRRVLRRMQKQQAQRAEQMADTERLAAQQATVQATQELLAQKSAGTTAAEIQVRTGQSIAMAYGCTPNVLCFTHFHFHQVSSLPQGSLSSESAAVVETEAKERPTGIAELNIESPVGLNMASEEMDTRDEHRTVDAPLQTAALLVSPKLEAHNLTRPIAPEPDLIEPQVEVHYAGATTKVIIAPLVCVAPPSMRLSV